MTERGPLTGLRGAPNPDEPAPHGDAPAQAPQARLSAVPPVDLSAVRRTDALFESLAARDAAGSAAPVEGSAEMPAEARRAAPQDDDRDPAVRLLRALIVDVDEQTRDAPGPPAPSGPGPRRRGPRTIVALGVAGAVLASSGVAAAGGGVAERGTASPAPSASGVAEDADRAADTDPGTRARPRPPVRPAPEAGRPAARTPSGDPGRGEDRRFKRRLEKPFPRHLPRRPPHRQEAPTMFTEPFERPDAKPVAGPRTRLDDLRRMARKRALDYQNRPADD
ncbi:hypothetical protein [Actinomadura mexicana]|uniref:Uncharacterized protein n=1 Tax=Actinomadura mexicana TaxID=134959 RepID=A0A239CET3_9ACTN|nr:hypothetical protein [Actinomadura mexicana]SNS18168.1 hypothetical protein SAMN06265355_112146 [Actinomadura mexicana]